MSDRLKENYKKITKYPNFIGCAAFSGLTLLQTVLCVIWISGNLTEISEVGGNETFRYKALISFALMTASVFLTVMTLIVKVRKREMKMWPYATVITLYIMTLPTVVSVNFDATLFAVCFSLEMLLTVCILLYFYDKHERRLFVLIAMFVVLCVLGYLNRAAFWAGIFESMVFLSIQLYRNLKTKRNNIADKSWRNTLLLFLILIIIMLMPQYFKYNNINGTLYKKSVEQQLSARLVVPYLEKEYMARERDYLLGVIRREDFDPSHGYESFNFLMHRYEEDGLDMEEIWSNLYKNGFHRYKKEMILSYGKNTVKGWLSPLLVYSEMNNSSVKSFHGYYYGLFQNSDPAFADRYMRVGLNGFTVLFIGMIIQMAAALIMDIASGKMKNKLEEGEHRIIEAVVALVCMGAVWTVCQTLFAMEGLSYVVSIGSAITWLAASPLIWIKRQNV